MQRAKLAFSQQAEELKRQVEEETKVCHSKAHDIQTILIQREESGNTRTETVRILNFSPDMVKMIR